jgi:hypothetical protein
VIRGENEILRGEDWDIGMLFASFDSFGGKGGELVSEMDHLGIE